MWCLASSRLVRQPIGLAEEVLHIQTSLATYSRTSPAGDLNLRWLESRDLPVDLCHLRLGLTWRQAALQELTR
jgi:hypothetical protein